MRLGVIPIYERHNYTIVFSRLLPTFQLYSSLLNTSPLSAEWHKHRHSKPWEWFWVVSGPQVSCSAASGEMQPGEAPTQDLNSQLWELQSAAQSRGQPQLWETRCRNRTRSQIMGNTVVSEDTVWIELASVWWCKSAAVSLVSLLRALC